MSEIGSIAEIVVKVHNFFLTVGRYTSRTTSLISDSKPVQVTPLVITDETLRVSEVLPSLNQSILCMYAGFYLQAIAVSTAEAEMHVSSRLEPFGTSVEPASALLREIVTAENIKQDYHPINHFTKEPRYKNTSLSQENILDELTTKRQPGTVNPDDVVKTLAEKTTMDVGKIVKVTFKKDMKTEKGEIVTKELSVPVAIRLLISFSQPDVIMDLLGFSMQDMSAAERRLGYKTGRLSFWKDNIFLRDVYVKFRRNLMRDKAGFFKSTIDRQSSSVIYKMLLGKKSTSGISNLVNISAYTAQRLEDKLGFRLSDYTKRNEMMENTGTMILAVIDDSYRVVRFYLHSIQRPIEAGFDELKRKNKGDNSSNIAEIMSALAMGNTPRL